MESPSARLAAPIPATTNANIRMAREDQEQRCWRTRCRVWKRACSSSRIPTRRRHPSCSTTRTASTKSQSTCQHLRLCTFQSLQVASSRFRRSHRHQPRRVSPLVGTGKPSQHSRRTLNQQARVVHRLRQFDARRFHRSQGLRFVFYPAIPLRLAHTGSRNIP